MLKDLHTEAATEAIQHLASNKDPIAVSELLFPRSTSATLAQLMSGIASPSTAT